MSDVSTGRLWELPGCPDDRETNPEVQTIMAHWAFVAAVAWKGFRECGPGTVMVDEEGDVSYCAGPPCSCHKQLMGEYDPRSQAVVALCAGEKLLSVHVVAGWLTPPEAARITPAELHQLTEH